MISKRVAKCPECSAKLPFWSHISFNQFIGIECPGCKAILTHQNYTFLVKVGLLVLFVFSLSRLIDGNIGVQWIVLCIASIVLLIVLQLSFTLLVRFRQ
jgi:hypothetical protein